MTLDCAAYASSWEKPMTVDANPPRSLDKQEDGNRQAWAVQNDTSATPTLTPSR